MALAVDPLRDPARLRAIHDAALQDDAAQETFGRLTRMVSRSIKAPIVMINLIDERRQLSLACVVPSTWPGEREASLQDSFCRHAVVAREPLLIEDTHQHPLVSSSQITTHLGVRSYLGLPLITSGGHALGTICVADFVPRVWTEDEVQTLGDLAASAVTEVELRLEVARQRQLQESLRESEVRFRVFVDSVRDYAILMLDAEGSVLGWSRGAEQLTGYPREEVVGCHFSTLLPAGHEQADRAERLALAALTRGHVEEEGWMLRKGSSRFWGSTAVTALRKHDGDLIGYAMLTRDLTERRHAEEALRNAHAALERRVEERTAELASANEELRVTLASLRRSEERFRLVLESITDYGVMMLDPRGRILEWNSGAEAASGFGVDEALGRSFSLVYLPEQIERGDPEGELREVRETGRAVREDWRRRKDGTLYWDFQVMTRIEVGGEVVGFARITRDLTRRREMEQALEREREFLRALLESLSEGIVACDAEGRLTLFNGATREFHGIAAEPLAAEAHAEHYSLYRADGRTRMAPGEVPLLRALRGEVVRDVQMVISPPDREPRRLLASGRAIYNAQGEKLGAVVAMHDITERARAEEELLRLGRRHELILETAADGIFGVDAAGRATFVNGAAARMLGYEVSEIVGQSVHALVHHSRPDGSRYPREECPMHATIRDATPRQVDDEFLWAKGGTAVPVEYTSSPLVEEGRVTGAVVTFRDISERLRTEERARALVREQAIRMAAEEAERRVTDILESITDAFFAYDREWRFTYVNRKAESLLRASRGEVLGRVLWEVFPQVAGSPFHLAAERVMRERIHLDLEAESYLTPGRWMELHVWPTAEGVSVYAADITERRRAQEALHAAKQEAERANRAKSEFLGRMSHELRTPLNAILGFGQLLEMDSTVEDRESVEQILRAGRHLLGLVDEVLNLARIEAGGMRMSLEPVAVAETVGECVDLVRPLAARREISITVAAGPVPPSVHADAQRLRQVLINLLSNAIKYNHDGGSVDVAVSAAPGEMVRIEVRDTGWGLSAEQQEQLFTPFQRLAAESSQVDGTGLGLALSKGLAEAMGGRIGVESQPGAGSTFWFELPRAEPPE